MIVVVITEETTESLLELLFLIDSSISLWEKKIKDQSLSCENVMFSSLISVLLCLQIKWTYLTCQMFLCSQICIIRMK